MIKQIFIEGMSCEHCVNHVKEALVELNGVTSVEVSLSEKVASIQTSVEVSNEEITDAITEVGYEVIKIENL